MPGNDSACRFYERYGYKSNKETITPVFPFVEDGIMRGDVFNILEKINDDQSRIIANAERKILKILEGDCDTAVGVYAKIDKDLVNIKAELFSVDGKQRFFVEESENKKMVKDLSIKIGEKLKSESKGSYKR